MSTASSRGRNSRRRGQQWERDVARWLNDQLGWDCLRRIDNTRIDSGDFEGLPDGIAIDAKSGTFHPGPMLDQLAAIQANTGADHVALFVKRHGKASVDDAYVVLPAHVWAQLTREAIQ